MRARGNLFHAAGQGPVLGSTGLRLTPVKNADTERTQEIPPVSHEATIYIQATFLLSKNGEPWGNRTLNLLIKSQVFTKEQ
jgi:hypothetical protein